MSGLDVRLAPAALTAWVAAWAAVLLEARTTLALAVPALLATLGAAGWALTDQRRRARRGQGRHRAAVAWSTPTTIALTFAVLTTVLLATAGHQHARSTGLLPQLSGEGAIVTLTGTARSDPRPVAAGARGGDDRHRLVVAVTGIEGRGLRGTAAARVLVLGGDAWAEAALGQRLTATGRLQPTEPGDDVVALLVSHQAPRVLAEPRTTGSPTGCVPACVAPSTAPRHRRGASCPASRWGTTPGCPRSSTPR